ncbi:hypothetical protein PQX77_022008 [Marasmius sp. AFHP31]|nr:hypothetical protein PQX77_022008 [Marasmius sp. AFHP31]
MALVLVNSSNPCAVLADSFSHAGLKGFVYGNVGTQFMPKAYPDHAVEPHFDHISGRMVFRGTEAVMNPIFDKYRFAARLVVSSSDIDREVGEIPEGIPKDILNSELAMPIDSDLLDYPHVTLADAEMLNPFRAIGFQSVEGVLQFCRNLETLFLKVARWIHGRIQLSVAKGLKSRVNWGAILGLTPFDFLEMVAPGVTRTTDSGYRDVDMKDHDEDIIMEETNTLSLILHPLDSHAVRSGLLHPYDPTLAGFDPNYYAPSAFITSEDEDVAGLIDYLVKDIEGAIPL